MAKNEASTNGASSVEIAADLTKWTLCAAVSGALLYRRDELVILFVLGAVLNGTSGKILKRLINESRPETTTKQDPGMPSSHATSLSFLSLAFVSQIASKGAASGLVSVAQLVGCGAIVVLALVASSWRVSAGYHTVPQVVAGWILGSVNTLLWLLAFVPTVGPLIGKVMTSTGVNLFIGIVLLGGGLFVLGPDIKKFIQRAGDA